MSERSVEVEFGPERVRVPEGGYYDRFRMNPDLNEVARDPAVGANIHQADEDNLPQDPLGARPATPKSAKA